MVLDKWLPLETSVIDTGGRESTPWLRTNGVDTNGAAAEVMVFDRLGKKVRPGTFGEYKSRLTGGPKKSLCQKHEICSDPISADPICPSPSAPRGDLRRLDDARVA